MLSHQALYDYIANSKLGDTRVSEVGLCSLCRLQSLKARLRDELDNIVRELWWFQEPEMMNAMLALLAL